MSSGSPTGNRSFLHGDRKPSSSIPNSDKVVYATLDSLALKRARLPLQLVPIDTSTSGKTEDNDKIEKRPVNRKPSTRRPSFKVRPGCSSQWKYRHRVFGSVVPNGKFDNAHQKESAIKQNSYNRLANPSFQRVTNKKVPQTVPELLEELIETQSSPNAQNDKHRKIVNYSKISKTDLKKFKNSINVENDFASNPKSPSDGYSTFRSNVPLSEQSHSDVQDRLMNRSKKSDLNLNTPQRRIVTENAKHESSKRQSVTLFNHSKLNKNSSKYAQLRASTGCLKSYKSDFSDYKSITSKASKLKSLSREELKYVTISQPTNFVHIASATNPILMLNENSSNSDKIITHEQTFAHLPLLAKSQEYTNVELGKPLKQNGEMNTAVGSNKYVQMLPATILKNNAFPDSGGNNFTKVENKFNITAQEIMNVGTKNKKEPLKRLCTYNTRHTVAMQSSVLEAEKPLSMKKDLKNEVPVEREDEEIYEPMAEFSARPKANSSFLWRSQQSKQLIVTESENPLLLGQKLTSTRPELDLQAESFENIHENVLYGEEYDDVGPGQDLSFEEDQYDDVGPPALPDRIIGDLSTRVQEEAYDYDDVMPPNYDSIGNCTSEDTTEDNDYLIPNAINDNRYVSPTTDGQSTGKYKTVRGLLEENQYLSINNEYSTLGVETVMKAGEEVKAEIEDEQQSVYDDVGLPLFSQERVNSLYAGSSAGSQLGSSTCNGTGNEKESEWEDLEDSPRVLSSPLPLPLPLPRRNVPCLRSGEVQSISALSKKNLGKNWSQKVRRQRSKASRKGSAGSSSQTTHDHTSSTVAVSLGTGSVLLVGLPERSADVLENGKRSEEPQELESTRSSDKITEIRQGLVQLRVLLLDETKDVQELSCYVFEETGSEDSNYETLYSSQPDDFSSDSETEIHTRKLQNASGSEIAQIGAPNRPTPPPPREAQTSLTQTLGRRMKMLRRTWSLTKGSLGRMRRKTGDRDPEPESCIYDDACNANSNAIPHHTDNRKYFSFKKHFRKSLTGLSTFYLENNENGSAKNNSQDKEETYSNSSWYAQAGLWKDDDSFKSEQSNTDHYSVLNEEPLYQFYAAAAARVAFESDSDGYEEVEDVTPSSATTDLARPGHRTLWCQTPQVIHTGLLNRLTMEERKLQEAKFEILTSEASYLNSLRVLEDEFSNNPELVNEIITPCEREKLFGGVSDVRMASERLLADLENVWRDDPMLGGLPSILLKHAAKCSAVYVKYCSNQVSIDTTLKELRARKGARFLEVVSRIETHPACQSLSLHSFLMLPMQRVTRLPLLADAVLTKLPKDHAGRSAWEKVLSGLSQVVAECNEGARAAGQQAEMEALARKLEYSSKVTPIALKDRHLVRSGPVVQLSQKTDLDYKLTFGKKFHKSPLFLLLLTDYLLVAKTKINSHDETYTVIDCCKRNLIALELVSDDSPWAGRHAMLLTLLENNAGREVEYVLTCESDTERERWLDAVAKPSVIGERLYESWDCPQVMAIYSYSPRQPDELALQPGDVINVRRKMPDGWNNGEKLVDGEQGWFPGNYTKEVASEHVRARNLRQRHRLLALTGNLLQRRAKQSFVLH